MPKRKKPEGVAGSQEPLTGDRVEFQAPKEWVARVDAAASALGMSRSAYIRMAVNRQMDRDSRDN